MIEAKKLAYADMAKYIGDPRGQKLPVRTLLSKEWAAERAKLIDPDHAHCDVAGGDLPVGTDTTYLTVVDREGNMVSLIQSNYSGFGSGIVAPGTGFALHNRGGLFVLDPDFARCAGWAEASAAHDHSRVCAEGRYPRGVWNYGRMEPVAGARAVRGGPCRFQDEYPGRDGSATISKHTFGGCDVMMENRFSQKVRDELTAKGHIIQVMGAYSAAMGGGQAVLRDFATGVNFGASDPRKDGEAIPELPLE